ncbi:Arginyl-tRNA synthetase [Candidatus Protofrankia datiscae]|uniref:Arginine--tRNA ligase n=1 Tax=Candidatus Protofrankia datiscae TaxID=2716812 RepID=F8B1X8_9ACTN|nr:Arginyl-tRNA synthetase [Candidatus Protofrankia datiscae]
MRPRTAVRAGRRVGRFTGVTSLERLLDERLGAAFTAVAGEQVDPAIRRSQRADYQADAALSLARRLRRNPRDIAAEVVRAAELDDLCETVEVAGPGFINLHLAASALERLLGEVFGDERLGVAPVPEPEVVVVDYSGPNAAKEMHVGHLRSTIIGDAAVRLLSWLGHQVVRQNHIGDWGTPFGMLVEHLLDIGESEAAHELSVGDLNAFYRAARVKFDADEAFKERSRLRVVRLQAGDPTTRRLWHVLVGESKKYFLTVYSQLGVLLTEADFRGESSYNDQLGPVVDELTELGLLRLSDGALCAFPEGFKNRDDEPLPLIVRKRDGGYGYATTDLATIRHRIRDLHATRLLYVVGLPQYQHFEMIYEVAREAGWLRAPVRAEHIGHGSILGADGKMLRTRAGDSVKLVALLEQAVSRAADVIAVKNPGLDAQTRAQVAQAIGIGAVKYADLSTDRSKDYVFDLDRMLAFDGNTAPYLQYAHARICSVFRRAGLTYPVAAADIRIGEPEERHLAVQLLSFGDVVEGIVDSLEFHRLAGYLFSLATAFTNFYEKCPILRAEEPVRTSRVALCDLTRRALATGLGLLGITAPERM